MTPTALEELTARTLSELVRVAGLSADSQVRFTVGDVVDLVIADLPAGLEASAEVRSVIADLAIGMIAGGVIDSPHQ